MWYRPIALPVALALSLLCGSGCFSLAHKAMIASARSSNAEYADAFRDAHPDSVLLRHLEAFEDANNSTDRLNASSGLVHYSKLLRDQRRLFATLLATDRAIQDGQLITKLNRPAMVAFRDAFGLDPASSFGTETCTAIVGSRISNTELFNDLERLVIDDPIVFLDELYRARSAQSDIFPERVIRISYLMAIRLMLRSPELPDAQARLAKMKEFSIEGRLDPAQFTAAWDHPVDANIRVLTSSTDPLTVLYGILIAKRTGQNELLATLVSESISRFRHKRGGEQDYPYFVGLLERQF
jgi:hypothetical protein